MLLPLAKISTDNLFIDPGMYCICDTISLNMHTVQLSGQAEDCSSFINCVTAVLVSYSLLAVAIHIRARLA